MPRWTVSMLLVGMLLQGAVAAPKRKIPPPTLPPSPSLHAALQTGADAQTLAGRIDFWLDARLAEKSVVPADPVDDATFMRRAYLDLSGRIPDILQARDFLENPAPDKRPRLIDSLLAQPRYAEHMATVWGQLLVPPSNDPMRPRVQGVEFWLAQEFRKNTSYRDIVRQALDPAYGSVQGQFAPFAMFLQANEFKPENLAASTSRLFLGVKLECAQCHDHPFAPYTRQQFWEFAAFFAGTAPNQVAASPGGRTEIVIPATGKTVRARFLDQRAPQFPPNVDPRSVLTAWLSAPDNSWFARAAVNRVWEAFFGIGIIDPIEEPGDENPPSHPELLNELSQAFVAHDYDLRYLIKSLMLTRAYQRSSRLTHESQADLRLFARMAVRGLSPEQLFDSLANATRFESDQPAFNDPRFGQRFVNPVRADFLARFVNQDRRTEHQTSILQALYLMNGKVVSDATSLEQNKQLKYIAEGEKVKTSRKVEQLYLIALSRKPRVDEMCRLVDYVDRGGPTGDTRRALADVFWALLNSSEFALNH
jgi:hypothetical protein